MTLQWIKYCIPASSLFFLVKKLPRTWKLNKLFVTCKLNSILTISSFGFFKDIYLNSKRILIYKKINKNKSPLICYMNSNQHWKLFFKYTPFFPYISLIRPYKKNSDCIPFLLLDLSNNEALEREHKAQIRKEVEDRKHMKNLVQFQRDKLEYKAH